MLQAYLSQGYLMGGSYDSEIEASHDKLVPPHQIFPILDMKKLGEDAV